MEPGLQLEIQLGHLCNNRCVFCVSGQQTALGRARAADVTPALQQLSQARRRDIRKLTLLGGEPTLQPGFMDVIRHAVELGYEEIVIFTNGVKTARRSFIEQVMETGGRFTWRISLQGATRESHERTTRRPGSFGRIEQSLRHLADLGQRITVNMCVVSSNFESVGEFPGLLLPFGVTQLHLDMVRPMDAGQRSEDEYARMIPRYSQLVEPLDAMIRGFPDGFDVNIGNLPYCVAPHLAPWIHHDGETTLTVAADGNNALSRPWDKYEVKRRDKHKPARCSQCVFDRHCNGIFAKYDALHGNAEFQPVSAERLLRVDPHQRLLSIQLAPMLRSLETWIPPAPFESVRVEHRGDREVWVALTGAEPLIVALRPPGQGAASCRRFSTTVVAAPRKVSSALSGLAALWTQLRSHGEGVWHPLGADALPGQVRRPVLERLRRLRQVAPFGTLQWTELEVSKHGRRAELKLETGSDPPTRFWIEAEGGRIAAGYDPPPAPSEALIAGLRAVMRAIARGRAAKGPVHDGEHPGSAVP